MRASEFITESTGPVPDHHRAAAQGGYKFRDKGIDRTYNLNQIMKAAAMSDGKSTHALEMDMESFAGKNNMAYPYTELEHNMMKQAFNTVSDTDAHELIRDHKSREPEDTHKISPVSSFKGYKKK
jgi:hypothetical protein